MSKFSSRLPRPMFVVGLLGLWASLSLAVPLQNGSFEAPDIVGTNADVPNSWSVAGAGPVQLVSPEFQPFGQPLLASAGQQWVDLTGMTELLNQGLTQVFDTVASGKYTLSFDVGNLDYSGFGRATVQLLIDNTVVSSFFNDITNTGSSAMRWKPFSTAFTATAAQTTVTFLGLEVEGNTAAKVIGLDNVTVVPEPEGYALALAALGVLGIASRRRTGCQPMTHQG